MKENENFTITNLTKGRLPSLPFTQIKEKALGKDFVVSLVFAPASKTKKMNLIYREKDKTPNVLSFPLSKNEGEIFITPTEAKKQAKKFGRSYENFLQFLFIHGLIHLNGLDHGDEMEKEEKRVRKEFGI